MHDRSHYQIQKWRLVKMRYLALGNECLNHAALTQFYGLLRAGYQIHRHRFLGSRYKEISSTSEPGNNSTLCLLWIRK
jgi:hypothetical protein